MCRWKYRLKKNLSLISLTYYLLPSKPAVRGIITKMILTILIAKLCSGYGRELHKQAGTDGNVANGRTPVHCILILTAANAIVAPISFFPWSVTSKSKDNDNEIVEKSKKVGLDLLLGDTPSCHKETLRLVKMVNYFFFFYFACYCSCCASNFISIFNICHN